MSSNVLAEQSPLRVLTIKSEMLCVLIWFRKHWSIKNQEHQTDNKSSEIVKYGVLCTTPQSVLLYCNKLQMGLCVHIYKQTSMGMYIHKKT